MKIFCQITVVVWCLCGWAQAFEQAQIDAIENSVSQLGDDRYEVREQAADQLLMMIEKDSAVAKYLTRHEGHSSPEIRKRIRELIKDLPVTLKWIDPAKEKDMKSLNRSTDRIKLTVFNRSKITIQMFWIDWDGKRQPRRTLKPGQECTYAATYQEHIWLIGDEAGKGLGLYCPGIKDAQIVYRGTEGKEDK